MKRLGPLAWSQVVEGMPIDHYGMPRTVLHRRLEAGDSRLVVRLEGLPGEHVYSMGTPVYLLVLDDADAVAILAAAGLDPHIISSA